MKKQFIAYLNMFFFISGVANGDAREKQDMSLPQKISIPVEITDFDLTPYAMTSGDQVLVLSQVYSGLTRYNSEDKLVGDLSSHWSIDQIGKSITFYIDPHRTFENSEKILGQDIEEYFLRVIAQHSELDWIFSDLLGFEEYKSKKAKTISGMTSTASSITFKFSEMNTAFIDILASESTKISKADSGGRWMASGRYRIASDSPESIILIHRKLNSELHFRKISTRESLNARIKQGKFDFVSIGSSDEEYKHFYDTKVISGYATRLLIINNESKHLTVLSKQAIALAIDRTKITRISRDIDPQDVKSLVPYGMGANSIKIPDPHSPVTESKNEDLKIKMAKLSNENRTIRFAYTLGGIGKSLQEIDCITDLLTKVGFIVKREQVPFSKMVKMYYSGEFDITLLNYGPGYLHPDAFYFPFLKTGQMYNIARYSNPVVDELLNLSRSFWDRESQLLVYQKIDQHLKRDVPFIPLYFSKSKVLMKPKYNLKVGSRGFWYVDINEFLESYLL